MQQQLQEGEGGKATIRHNSIWNTTANLIENHLTLETHWVNLILKKPMLDECNVDSTCLEKSMTMMMNTALTNLKKMAIKFLGNLS